MAKVNFKRTGSKRLLRLADFIAKLPSKRQFSMAVLADHVEDGAPACGGAACALGWGASIPSFRRAGYRLTRDLGLFVKGVRSTRYDDRAAYFFGIDPVEAVDVFGWDQTHTAGFNARRDVVKRIRNLVKRKLKVTA